MARQNNQVFRIENKRSVVRFGSSGVLAPIGGTRSEPEKEALKLTSFGEPRAKQIPSPCE